MLLYSSKWQKICLIGLFLSLIILVISLIWHPAMRSISALSLSFFLFLLAVVQQSEESATIIAIRYQSLLRTFVVTFATVIALSITQLLIDEVIMGPHSWLIISIFFLSYYHIDFYSQLVFKKYSIQQEDM